MRFANVCNSSKPHWMVLANWSNSRPRSSSEALPCLFVVNFLFGMLWSSHHPSLAPPPPDIKTNLETPRSLGLDARGTNRCEQLPLPGEIGGQDLNLRPPHHE